MPHIAIVGGGVVGLSAGIAYLERHPRARVSVVAQDVPDRPATLACGGARATGPAWPLLQEAHPASYASAYAGAHHVSAAGGNARELRWDQATFARMRALMELQPWQELYSACSNAHAQPLVWVEQVEAHDLPDPPEAWTRSLDWYPSFRWLSRQETEELPLGCQAGCTFTTIDIVVPLYLPWLRHRFEQLGGQIIKQKVSSLWEAASLAAASRQGQAVDAIVNAAGTGSLTLDDVRDAGCYPVRGQVVRVQANGCTSSIPRAWLLEPPAHEAPSPFNGQAGRYRGFSRTLAEGYRDVYIIPMGNGEFVVGGTRLPHDWDTSIRDATTEHILRTNLRVFPELSADGTVDGTRINAVAVGLRPARNGGPNVSLSALTADGQTEVPLVSAYGFGGSGYQASWGVADEVVALVDAGLEQQRQPEKSRL